MAKYLIQASYTTEGVKGLRPQQKMLRGSWEHSKHLGPRSLVSGPDSTAAVPSG